MRFAAAVALVIGLAGLFDAQAEVRREGAKVVIENSCLRAVVDPARGAAVESLAYKQGNERIETLPGPTTTESVLLANDKLLPLFDQEFKPEAAPAAFSRMLPKGEPLGKPGSEYDIPFFPDPDYTGVKLEKRFSLEENEAALTVGYTVTNTGAQPVSLVLVLHQQFADAKGRGMRFLLPTTDGVETLGARQAKREVFALAAPWGAVLSDRGYGGVRRFDARHLSSLRTTADNSATLDAVTTVIELKPGASWSTETQLMPVLGMTALGAGGADAFAGIRLDPPAAAPAAAPPAAKGAPATAAPAKAPPAAPTAYLPRARITGRFTLVSAVRRAADVELTARRLPNGAPQRVAARTDSPFFPAQVQTGDFSFTPPEAGTWALTLQVRKGEQVFAKAEYPVVVGTASGSLPRQQAIAREGGVHHPLRKAFPPTADYQPTTAVPSPHIPYARPYAQGPVRVLFLVPYWSGREVVEIAQRLEMEYDAALMGVAPMKQKLEPKFNAEEEARRNEESAHALALLAKPHDVIVAAHSWRYWTDEVREEALRQVRQGAGLACFTVAWPDPELEALQKAARPTAGFEPDVKAADLGKGRVLFHGTGERGVMEGFLGPRRGAESGTYEKSVQAILYAARKDSPIQITCSLPAGDLVNTSGKPITVTLVNKGAQEARGKLEVLFRQALDLQYKNIYWFYFTYGTYPWWQDRSPTVQEVTLPPGGLRKIEIPLPPVPAGSYFVAATLRDEQGRVVSWRSQPAQVQSPLDVAELWLGKPGVEAVRADYATTKMPAIGFKPTETLQARVRLQREEGKLPGALSCSLRLVDGDGRLLFEEKKPVDAQGEAAFTAPMSHALHYVAIATATGYADDKPLAETRAMVPVHRYPERDQRYRFTQLDNEGWEPFRMLGISEYNNGSSWDRLLECASQDYLFQPFGGEVVRARLNKENVREFCFNNPDHRKKQFEQAAKNIRFAVQFAPHGHLFVDEYTYGGHQACQCEFCQAAYRRFLQRLYGTVEKLNQEYGTKHRSFDDARIFLLPDKEAVPPADWPQALDTCVWKTVQMTDYCGEIVKLGKAISPEVEFGFSGPYKMSLASGNDAWYCSQVGRYHILYRDWAEWASMVGSQHVRQWRWYWRKYNPAEQRWLAWECLFRGEPGTGIFTSESYPSCYADGSVFNGPAAYFKEFNEINRGPAKLLLGRDARDGIAIHWSSPSFYVYALERWERVAQLGKDPKKDNMMDWPRRTAHFIDGCSAGPSSLAAYYVADGQLAAGNLGLWGRPKVLFLTYSPAMSTAEAETIRRFVQEGGLLVGQVNPAARDAHGKPWPAPILDEVFGVRHAGCLPPIVTTGKSPEDVAADTRSKEKPKEGIRVTLPLDGQTLALYPLVLAPANVTAAGAQPSGEYTLDGRKVPAMFTNKFGKGQAVLLNFLMTHTDEATGAEWSEPTQKACAQIVAKLIEMAGVKPWATVASDPAALPVRLNRFEDGANVYLGVLADWGHPPSYYARKVEVALPRPCHVYDVRRGAYLGLTDKLQPSFAADWPANLYACLPYKVNALDLTPPAGPVRRGADVSLAAAVRADARPGRHVLRLEVWNPAGQVVEKYGYNFDAPGGAGTAHVFVALNDPTGEWKARCTDIATGASAETRFVVNQ